MTLRSRSTIVAAIAGSILLLARCIPSVEGGPVLCFFRRITGLPCPSCGMTRAFIALGHGDLHKAMLLNIASPFIYLAAWVILLLGIGELIWNRPLRLPLWKATGRLVFVFTLVLMGVAWIVNLAHYLNR